MHPPGACGVVISTLDHAGGLAAVERVIHETAGCRYRQSAAGRRSDLCAVQITLSGCGRAWPEGAGAGPGLAVPRGSCLAFRYGAALAYAVDPLAGSWEFVYANLCGAAAHDAIDELVVGGGNVLPCDPAHPAIARLASLARGPGVRHRRFGLAASVRLANDLLVALVEARRGTEAVADPLEAACARLVRGLAQRIDVADVADEVGVSREHLTRLFRRRLGLAPAAWLRRERLRQAELLLHDGGPPLAEVARRCGFATASHFVQAFRRSHGVTPGAWRPRSHGQPGIRP